MITLLKTEWLKLKNYTAFKLLAIFFLLGIVLTNYIVYVVNKNMISKSAAGVVVSAFNPYSFSGTWQTTSYTTGWLLILPALLIMMLVTNEYAYRTNRQNIIDGWSRSEFIFVKLLMAFIFAAVATVFVFFTALTFGFISQTDFSFTGISHLGFFFLKALTYNMFAVLISVLIKRTGFAIGLFFIYLGAENIISQLLDVLSFYTRTHDGPDMGSLGDYLPMNAADGLLTFPDNPLKSIAKGVLPTDYVWITSILAVLYLLLFIWWSRKKFIASDL